MTIPFDLTPWTAVGFVGQAFFGSRFLVQWIASERRKQSHFPIVFWYISLIGAAILTTYAVARGDIVFTLGQGLPIVIYVRNLMLIKRHRARLAAEQVDGSPSDSQCR